MVYVSLAERLIRIVPADDAARAVTNQQWQSAVDQALGPLAAGALEAALTGLAARCAELLSEPYPPGAGVDAAAAAALSCGLNVFRQFGVCAYVPFLVLFRRAVLGAGTLPKVETPNRQIFVSAFAPGSARPALR